MTESAQREREAWQNRRVLVTGADGFVGRWLVQALADRGSEVHALIRAGKAGPSSHVFPASVSLVSGDVTDLSGISRLIADARIETIYHLAANNINTGQGISPYAVFETNLRGVYTVLEASRKASVAPLTIIASSREVEDCFQPDRQRKLHPYMTSKAAAELVTKSYGDTFGISTVLVRSDNLYGGGDLNWSRLVPGTVRAILRGEVPIIRSNGLLRRDYVYIEDAVAAYLKIGEHQRVGVPAGGLFRIATGTSTSVLEMVKAIAKAAGKPELEPEILNENRDERVDEPYFPEMERRILGWETRHTITSGLDQTVKWYREHYGREASFPSAANISPP